MTFNFNKTLCALTKAMKINFTLHDKPISYDEVFSDTGLLPALTKRADQLCSLCLGYGVGAVFEDAEKTTTGVKVKFDDVTPNVLRLLCLCDVINELNKSSPYRDRVPLDELLYD